MVRGTRGYIRSDSRPVHSLISTLAIVFLSLVDLTVRYTTKSPHLAQESLEATTSATWAHISIRFMVFTYINDFWRENIELLKQFQPQTMVIHLISISITAVRH